MTVFGALVIAILLVVFWRVVVVMLAVGVLGLLILGISTVVEESGAPRGSGSNPVPSAVSSAESPNR